MRARVVDSTRLEFIDESLSDSKTETGKLKRNAAGVSIIMLHSSYSLAYKRLFSFSQVETLLELELEKVKKYKFDRRVK